MPSIPLKTMPLLPPFTLTSPAFAPGQPIPVEYSCDGADISPPLNWTNAPVGTESFALVVQDPDAPSGLFHHWGIYNIPVGTDHLAKDFPPDGAFTQAHNDKGQNRYSGPCPPTGDKPHRYIFRLFALDIPTLNLPDHTKVEAIEKAALPHLLGTAELIGTFRH